MPQLNPSLTQSSETQYDRKRTGIRILSASVATTVLTITFDQAVIIRKVPQYTTDVPAATPVSATLTSPTTLAITFSADISAATEVRIPYQNPGIRSEAGGYVADSTFPV